MYQHFYLHMLSEHEDSRCCPIKDFGKHRVRCCRLASTITATDDIEILTHSAGKDTVLFSYCQENAKNPFQTATGKFDRKPVLVMKAGAVVFGWNQQKGLNNQTLFHETFLLLYEILLLVG